MAESHAAGYGALSSGEIGTRPITPGQTINSGRLSRLATRMGTRFFPLGYWREVRALLRLHVPAFLTCFFQFFLQTVSVMMCGHLSKEELDAVALACTLINVAGLGIGVGLATGCDTYFAQTYGSSNKKRCGLYLQRSLIVMYMALIPVYCLHLNIRPLLLLLGQDPRVSDLAADYILLFLPGVLFDYTFLVLARYLQTQNRLNAPLVCACLGNIFNAASQYVGIFVLGFGYQASAICQAASLLVMCTSLIAYILYSRVYEETWSGWSREAWYDIGGFVRLAVPGLLFVCIEELSFEIGTFVAGAISTLQLAAQGIVFQSSTLSYMASLGMSIAVNIRVGQHLGAGRTHAARHTYRVAATIMLCISLSLVAAFAFGSRTIASLFTSDPEVLDATAELMQVYAGFPIVDGLSATGSGVLKGCGKQLPGAVINVIAYYGISLPIGIPLSFTTELKVKAIWIGLLIGLSLETMVFWLMIWRIDWPGQVAEAQARAAGTKVVLATQQQQQQQKLPAAAAEAAAADAAEDEPLLGESSHSRSPSIGSRARFHAEVELNLGPVTRGGEAPPSLRWLLLRRGGTICCLLAALAAAVCLRAMQQPLLPAECLLPSNATQVPPPAGNATVC